MPAARIVHEGFAEARARFREITARASERFEQRDWHGALADMAGRLELHAETMSRLIERLEAELGPLAADEPTWREAKASFATLVAGTPNQELAETFFNSVTRRLLHIVGKNPETEFDADEYVVDPQQESREVYDAYAWSAPTAQVIEQVLRDRGFNAAFEDLARDAQRVAAEIDDWGRRILGRPAIDAIEVLKPIFYRQKLAFVIGRIRAGNSASPLVLPLRHGPGGIAVDAVLTGRSELSVIFSFTRSHFHVATDCPRDLIVFLKGIMPLKPVAELYIALGFYKHGKTELYRSLRRHLRSTVDRFEAAKGDAGMVMLVFNLPFHNMVFKVIRDRFAPPKSSTPAEVKRRYRLVFRHDRVGRLVEAQEFEDLELRVGSFRTELLDELLREAPSTVSVRGDAVVLRHVYIERKVEPLNLFLRQATESKALEAVRDYGAALRELAAANIFPGDFLLKNFGVTSNGRVVFYDYDELCELTDCRFRRMPQARHPEDEMAAEPWFSVGENDVFPEEFERFLGFKPAQKVEFLKHHRALFTVEFWAGLQQRLAGGEIVDVYPYPERRRLHA